MHNTKRVYTTIADALKDGKNVGLFGALDVNNNTQQFREWRMFGDCLESNDGSGWSITPQVVIEHPFSQGVYADRATTSFVFHPLVVDEMFEEVFGC